MCVMEKHKEGGEEGGVKEDREGDTDGRKNREGEEDRRIRSVMQCRIERQCMAKRREAK